MSSVNSIFRQWFYPVVLIGITLYLTAPVLADSNAPLGDDERSLVVAAAVQELGIDASVADGVTAAPDRRALLLVERRPGEKGSATRRANVFVYNYRTNVVDHVVVDVAAGDVVHRQSMADVQLPLINYEIQWATNIVFTHAAARARLEEEFERVTGRRLHELSEIRYKAFTFVADPSSPEAVGSCGARRCAQILMYTADSVVLDVSPVVDLSSESVLLVTSDGAGMDGSASTRGQQ